MNNDSQFDLLMNFKDKEIYYWKKCDFCHSPDTRTFPWIDRRDGYVPICEKCCELYRQGWLDLVSLVREVNDKPYSLE